MQHDHEPKGAASFFNPRIQSMATKQRLRVRQNKILHCWFQYASIKEGLLRLTSSKAFLPLFPDPISARPPNTLATIGGTLINGLAG